MVVNPEPHLRPLTGHRDPTRDRVTGPPEHRSIHHRVGSASTARPGTGTPGAMSERRPTSPEPETRPNKKRRATHPTIPSTNPRKSLRRSRGGIVPLKLGLQPGSFLATHVKHSSQ
jgi:hypothetical protein